MDIFEKNINSLQLVNPLLAKKLQAITSNTIFEVYANESYENANILDSRDNSPIYVHQPIDEIESTLTKLQKFKFYKSLYFTV